MRPRLPHTPFSTPFSSSKKLVEARIRGVIAGPQKRPPLLLLFLVFAFCFLSVNLVSCQPFQPSREVEASLLSLTLPDGGEVYLMEEEPRDDQRGSLYIEGSTVGVLYYRPAGGEAVELDFLDYGPEHPFWNSVSLEPFSDVLGADGFIFQYVVGGAWDSADYYAVEGGGAILIAPCHNYDIWQEDLDGDGELELMNNYHAAGFLDVYDREGGQVICTQLNDAARDMVYAPIPEDAWISLTRNPDGSFTASWVEDGRNYERQLGDPTRLYYIARSAAPVQDAVPDEEAARRMAELLPDYALDQSRVRILLSVNQGDKRLILFRIPSTSHAGGFDDLVAGVWDETAQEVSGEAWISRGDDGWWSTWMEGDALYLLLTNYSVYSGEEIGEPPVWLRFEDGVLEHPSLILPDAAREAVPELPGDAVFFDPMNTADYWYDHKAIPVEGGLELYTAHKGWRPVKGTPRARWRFSGRIPLSEAAAFQATGAAAGEAIQAVFMGSAGFYYEPEFMGEPGTFLTIKEIPSILNPDNAYPGLDFAAADLDGDGEDEYVLRSHGDTSDPEHFLILTWKDGEVRGEPATEEGLLAALDEQNVIPDLEWHEY